MKLNKKISRFNFSKSNKTFLKNKKKFLLILIKRNLFIKIFNIIIKTNLRLILRFKSTKTYLRYK